MAKRISIIAAMGKDHSIGKDNKLPWRLPEDHANFRRVTAGKPFLMGRKSYVSEDALLSDRRNVILSRSSHLKLCSNCEQVGSLNEAMNIMQQEEEEWMVLGGAGVFTQILDRIDYLYLTIVDGEFEADAYFPALDWSAWDLVKSRQYDQDQNHNYSFALNEYQRRDNYL